MTAQERMLIVRTPRRDFDSRQGIERIISNQEGDELESAVKNVTHLRRLYREFTGSNLFEFVVNGQYLLSPDGSLHKIVDKFESCSGLVMIRDDFNIITGEEAFITEEVM